MPDDPVRRLDEVVRRLIQLAVLEPQLDQLWEIPLRGDAPAVAPDELLVALERDLREAVGHGLGRVVLPQLGPGVLARPPAFQRAERNTVSSDGEHRAGGEVDADPGDLRGGDAELRQHASDALLQCQGPVVRVLERPVGWQPLAAFGQGLVDHPVRVRRARSPRVPRRRADRAAALGPIPCRNRRRWRRGARSPRAPRPVAKPHGAQPLRRRRAAGLRRCRSPWLACSGGTARRRSR